MHISHETKFGCARLDAKNDGFLRASAGLAHLVLKAFQKAKQGCRVLLASFGFGFGLLAM